MVSPSSNSSLRKPKLTPKQAKLVKGVAQGMTKREAARQAGYSGKPETLSVTASEVLRKPNVQEALQMALEKHDLTPQRLAGIVDEAMSSTKTVILGSGDDAFADVVPDHSIRLKAAGMAAQWMGIGKETVVSGGVHFHQHTAEKKQQYDD